MFCQKCGASNDDALKFCVSCGTPLLPVQAAAPGEATTALNEAQIQPPTAPAEPVPPYQPEQPVYTPPPAAVPPYQPPAQPAYTPPPPPQKKKGHAGLMIAIVALLLIGVAAAVLLITKPWAHDENETTAPGTTVSQTMQQETTVPPETTNAEGTTAVEETTNEGDTTFFGGTQWPTDGLYTKLPKPDFGNILAVYADEAEGTASASLTDVTQANYDSYVEALRSMGFTKNVSSGTFLGIPTYSASNTAGEKATVALVPAMNTMTIALDVTP